MVGLMPVVGPAMGVVGFVVIGTGTAMALILRWNILDTFLSTGWGWAILIGFAVSVAGFVMGMGFTSRTGNQMVRPIRTIQGRVPTPEEAPQVERLGRRLQRLRWGGFVLVLIAVGAMVAARFV